MKRMQKSMTKKQIDNVAESIRQFGFVQPVVAKNNNVIIGHCRLLAAKELRLDEVPCYMADDLDEEQVKELRLLDNKLNESPWDFELLADEIEELDFEGFDVEFNLPTKISDDMLNDFFEDAEQKEKEPKRIQCPHCGEWFETYQICVMYLFLTN